MINWPEVLIPAAIVVAGLAILIAVGRYKNRNK